jgi:hypothetical protein
MTCHNCRTAKAKSPRACEDDLTVRWRESLTTPGKPEPDQTDSNAHQPGDEAWAPLTPLGALRGQCHERLSLRRAPGRTHRPKGPRPSPVSP